MKVSHLCNRDLFLKVKESVSMQQVAEYYGFKADRKGFCMCPFHHDRHPSLKLYENGKGFYCFSCGTGGDVIKFAALYKDLSNTDAARELAAVFNISVEIPATYSELRKLEKEQRHRKETERFQRYSVMFLRAYWGLLCEAARGNMESPKFTEAVENREYIEYLIECLKECPQEVLQDERAVKRIEQVKERVIGWYTEPEAGSALSG